MSEENRRARGEHPILSPVQHEAPDSVGKKTGGAQMASGYGNHGASTTKNAFLGWIIGGGAPDDDIDLNASTLRQRARDLDMGGGIPRSAVATETTTVIGTGMIPKPSIDYEALGISKEQAQEWEKITKREFEFWAGRKFCDAAERKNFYQIQSLAYRSFLVSGDVIALLPMFDSPGTPYTLHVQLLEADRLATPESGGESTTEETTGGGRIIDGVEIDQNGRVVRYHIASRHPHSENQSGEIVYTPIDAYGKDTGMPNVLHVYVPERPEQYRGVPMVAAIIEKSKQLDRYLNAELMANVVASMFTLFIVSDGDNTIDTSELVDAVSEENRVTADPTKLHLSGGSIYELSAGKKPIAVNPMRPNSAFAAFVDAFCTQLGASIEMPKEILLKAFTKSYSASRAALTEYWRKIPRARRDFIADFCQPIYEAFLAEAVAIGRIKAPGFFEDPFKRWCYSKCQWIGSTMQQLDPLKEVQAAKERIALNISTEEREAAEFNGSDWEENISQREKELEALLALKTALAAKLGTEQTEETGPYSDEPNDGDEDGDDDENAEEETDNAKEDEQRWYAEHNGRNDE